MSTFEISVEAIATDRFVKIRDEPRGLLEYMASAGKQPSQMQLYAGDYRYVANRINARLKKEARAKQTDENRARRAAKQKADVVIKPQKVEALTYRGIPVASHSYSRPRQVKA